MLNTNLFKEQILRLMDMYPTWQIDYESDRTLQNWYDTFKDLHDVQFVNMVDKYIDTKESSPTAAGLKSCKEYYEEPFTPERMAAAKKKMEDSIIEGKNWSHGGGQN